MHYSVRLFAKEMIDLTICFLMGEYPTEENPINAFTDVLITEMANQGVTCVVIAPQSRTEHLVRGTKSAPMIREKTAPNGSKITIYSPKYNSYSAKNIFGYNTARLTQRSYDRVVLKEFIKRNIKPDVLYGKFFSLGGLAAARLGDMFGIPSFVDNGESTLNSLDILNRRMVVDRIKKLSGIISVSTENKRKLIESGYVDSEFADKMFVALNSVDEKKFFKVDKLKARQELGFPEEAFIASFVGHFVERKGIGVLSDVLNDMEDVYSIFIGRGPLVPNVKNTLHCGTVPHDKVYMYLNASDVFVLPTLAEGLCNAILEALACGVPVVSSDLPFNYDVLDESCSILVDPKNKEEIRSAILRIKEDEELKKRLSEGALEKASKFSLKNRIANILDFIQMHI